MSLTAQMFFIRLIPHQCLGATRSRDTREDKKTTVGDTIDQSNTVLFALRSNILIAGSDAQVRDHQSLMYID